MENNFFGKIRIQAFSLWKMSTNRDCNHVNDNFADSFECKWQNRAIADFGYEHISIFCSLGDWANNISDILREEYYDGYSYLDEEQRLALFRYNTRLLLVISEILTDFENIILVVETSDTKKVREFFSYRKGEIDDLLAFINNVCKHKINGLHRCNHHLPIWFEDCQTNHPFKNPISIGNLQFDHPDGILMPGLNYFIRVIIQCYTRLDDLFENDVARFETICEKYDGVSLS